MPRLLAGLDREGRPWLPPRLRGEPDALSIRDVRTARLLRRNLGTILAEERVTVMTPFSRDPEASAEASWTEIGNVDQAFADRLQPGDRFLLDGRCLEFRRREGAALYVDEVCGRPATPRWGGGGWAASTELARRLFLLREQAAEALRDEPAALAELLRRDFGVEDDAAALLLAYFQRQERFSEIPDGSSLLIEEIVSDLGADYFLHTPLNRNGNDALARVAVHRLARNLGAPASAVVADLGFALRLRDPLQDPPAVVRTVLSAADFDSDLGAALADGPALRQRFGQTAITGLMLLRNPLGHGRRSRRPRLGRAAVVRSGAGARPGFRIAAAGGAGNQRKPVRRGDGPPLCRRFGLTPDPLSAAVGAVAVRRRLDAGRGRGGRPGGNGGGGAATLARGADGRRH